MRFIIPALFMVSGLSQSAFSETFDVSKIESSRIEWLAVGNPGFLKIESKNGRLSGEMTIEDGFIAGTFISKLSDMKTGMRLRDSHMHDNYLHSKKYPEAKFTLNAVKVASAFKATGSMYLHNVTKDMDWDCQAAKNDGVRKISCVSKIVLTDFNIDVPSYLGVTVAKDVKVKVVLVI